nr:hypothetical protein [Acidobacteriota bacterium]
MLTIRRLAIAGLTAGAIVSAADRLTARSATGITPAPSTQTNQTVDARLKELRAEAERLSRDQKTLLNELGRLQVDRDMKVAELDARTLALQGAEAALGALEVEQAGLAASIERQRPVVRARIVELYKRGRASDLRRLVDAASARDAMRAWRQMAAASARDASRFAEHRGSIARLDQARGTLASERREADRL